MSTVVYQNLHHCYDSNNFVESRQLSLKLNAPKSQSFVNSYVEDVSSKPDNEPYNKYSSSNMFGWSGIETPSKQEEPVYIHPLVKNSASKLSQKSLEMCTESLGCETGTCIMDNSVFLQSTMAKEVRKPRPMFQTKKEITHVKLPLPPPLTTITGPNSLRVEPVRENGRLVIKAVSTPTKQPCLQAERSNGRLRLSLIRDYSSDDDCETSDYNEPEDFSLLKSS
ncbi:protein FANTASTIC FOUR 3-like [Silene latifolia]|uniref:protein FANTASTIC FOUR 3-like n=1 Tax=Silene latifolia TaxID=37657 RepID=UPI003D775F5A